MTEPRIIPFYRRYYRGRLRECPEARLLRGERWRIPIYPRLVEPPPPWSASEALPPLKLLCVEYWTKRMGWDGEVGYAVMGNGLFLAFYSDRGAWRETEDPAVHAVVDEAYEHPPVESVGRAFAAALKAGKLT